MSDEDEQKSCCKRIIGFMFSYAGLVLIVIFYCAIGGVIFENLEKPNELQECEQQRFAYLPVENSTLEQMYLEHLSVASTVIPMNKDEVKSLFQVHLQQFLSAALETDYDLTNCSMMGKPTGRSYKWSYAGSLLFAVTVVSTIGYGNIAPVTTWGRVVVMLYAIIGIPIMLLCLANIGDVMADFFRFVYTKVCCCGCCKRKTASSNSKWNSLKEPDDEDDDEENSTVSVPLTITLCVIFGYIVMGALLFGVWEGWDGVASFYFCFVTLTTIGFGDFVPGFNSLMSTEGQIKMLFGGIYVLFGLAMISMCFNLMQDGMVAKFRWLGTKLGCVKKNEEEEDHEVATNVHVKEPTQNYYDVNTRQPSRMQ